MALNILRNISDLFYSAIPKSSYLRNHTGNTNLIITAPHGGNIKPLSIPRRKFGNQLKDTYTRTLTEEIINLLDKKPYYIISDIHRSRVDLNRTIWEGCERNPKAEAIWNSWDKLLQRYTNEVTYKFNKGLYIDIHSHNNGNYFQLGYNLNASSYRKLYNGNRVSGSTLDSLGRNLREMIFGNGSISDYLKKSRYSVLYPSHKELYFNGGRNIEVYSGNGIGAIQIECPVSILRYNLFDVAIVLSEAILRFKEEFVD